MWKNYIDWNLFIIAGGSVLSSLLSELPLRNGSDVDLFFLKGNSKLFKRAVVSLNLNLFILDVPLGMTHL